MKNIECLQKHNVFKIFRVNLKNFEKNLWKQNEVKLYVKMNMFERSVLGQTTEKIHNKSRIKHFVNKIWTKEQFKIDYWNYYGKQDYSIAVLEYDYNLYHDGFTGIILADFKQYGLALFCISGPHSVFDLWFYNTDTTK